ncbi:MAG TPA: type II secretion system protein [Burkholderiaceae bacterium]
MTRRRGFTLIELVVTLLLVSVLALVAVPLYEVTATRVKESELRTALRQIRTALDAYKQATDTGVVAKDATASGYPPSLAVLVQGVDTVASTNPTPGQGTGPGAGRIVFLRQVPRDPFFQDQTVPPDQQWNIRAYAALPDDFSGGPDVYDVASKSTGVGLNGIPYKDW